MLYLLVSAYACAQEPSLRLNEPLLVLAPADNDAQPLPADDISSITSMRGDCSSGKSYNRDLPDEGTACKGDRILRDSPGVLA
jgi:hypothetical protein